MVVAIIAGRDLGDLEGAGAAPLHRDRRRARRCRSCSCWSRCSSSISPSARSGRRAAGRTRCRWRSCPGANRGTVDDPAAGQAPRRRPAVRRARLPAVGGPGVRRAAPLRRHRPPRRRRLPAAGLPARPGPRRLPRPPAPGRDGHGGYAPRFLRYPAGSERAQRRVRRAAQGRACRADRDGQFRGYQVDKTDSPGRRHPAGARRLPAPDARASCSSSASLGAVVLLGFLSLAVILAQVVALVLLGVRAGRAGDRDLPARRARLLPQLARQARDRGLHQGAVLAGDRDRRRGRRRARPVDRRRSGSCSPSALQAIFFWAIFLYRKQITARLVAATTGGRLRRTDAAHDRRAARRRHRHAPVRRARRHARPRRTRRRRAVRRARSPAATRHATSNDAPRRATSSTTDGPASQRRPTRRRRANGDRHARLTSPARNGRAATLDRRARSVRKAARARQRLGRAVSVAAESRRPVEPRVAPRDAASPSSASCRRARARGRHAPRPRAARAPAQGRRRREDRAVIDRLRALLNRPLRDGDRARLFVAAVAVILAGAGALALLDGPAAAGRSRAHSPSRSRRGRAARRASRR